MTETFRVLLLDSRDAPPPELTAEKSARSGRELRIARSRSEFTAALEEGSFDLIVTVNGVEGLDGTSALKMARKILPSVPFAFVTALSKETLGLAAHAAEEAAISKAPGPASEPSTAERTVTPFYVDAMEHLIGVIQELSLARTLPTVMDIVRRAARRLSGSDGATFVLRDGDKCFYAEEDAISPLWKGQRFPMSRCISGWVMLNREPAVIEDIYADDRIPADAYRPTFVKSLVMVPIRTAEPIGAIGTYWATHRIPDPNLVRLLQALADSVSIALDHVQLYSELERRVQDRTAQLEAANRELESFSYAVSHDLRSPLQKVVSFSEILSTRYARQLETDARFCIERIVHSATRMSGIIQDLLRLSRIMRQELNREPVDLSSLAATILERLREAEPHRRAEFRVAPGVTAVGDAKLLEIALENLLANAWKFTSRVPEAVIEFGVLRNGLRRSYFVRDNGSGFPPEGAESAFLPFRRLHAASEFPGEGIGLSIVKRVVDRHGGVIRAEGEPGRGATFTFDLGENGP